MKELDKLRDEIDRIDAEILEKLNERVEVVLKIRDLKEKNCLPVEDLAREEEIIKKLHPGRCNEEYIRELYRVIFSYSKSLLRETDHP